MMKMYKNSSSFRDPSGFIFEEDGTIYRQINKEYFNEYERLMISGLYDKLVSKDMIISHEETQKYTDKIIIQPQNIDFITYPYEWAFSQYKDAALLTLDIQKLALEHNMTLKDASAFNIQFIGSLPVFIDTLSFEKYVEGSAWNAYGQFCRHFLAPLLLMSKVDLTLNKLMLSNIDGINLSLATKLLPKSTIFNPLIFIHLYLHTKMENNQAQRDGKKTKISKYGLLGIIDQLQSIIKNLKLKTNKTEWSDYYSNDGNNYTDNSFAFKKEMISKWAKEINPKRVVDIGANTGVFSEIFSNNSECFVLSCDIDTLAVEKNYVRNKNVHNLLPLIVDISNPTPAIGFDNLERESFINRVCTLKADVVLALAVIHHLRITAGIPLAMLVELLAKIANEYLIIEFVPKSDSMVVGMLSSRDDIFDDYDSLVFEDIFSSSFTITDKVNVVNSDRILYRMMKNR